MPSESPYKTGLEPKILSRARTTLGSLLLVLTVITIAGAHQGVVSGDFDRVLVKPFREFAADLKKAANPSPTPTPTPRPSTAPSPTPMPTKKPTPVVKKTQPVYSNCIRKNIREGEFASNRCYAPQDYEDLEYYLGRYYSAVSERDTQEAFIGVTCPGMSDMFKKSCEEHKQKKATAEANIGKYKGIVLGIIAKGR
ncbi:hypothetical protein FJZ40_00995 [Candidatus Shapirobacteria bacterium]|nr:hypothetical protein [Candidatus Shapirobacteria bacterium]